MNPFDIYVHGTPRGHQICGSEHNHDYISSFYNHDNQATEKVALQIDVCNGDSFYTYIRHQNVFDVEGRPKAFFALTIGFRRAYCTKIYILYQLFDAIYNQICVGSILKHSGNGESYTVADLTEARSGADATVDKIQTAFTQKITELIVPSLQPLSSNDTFNKTKKMVSLLEVDSPLFFDYFKKYSIVVSPDLQTSAYLYDKVSYELKQMSDYNKTLSDSNEKLKSELASLAQEHKSRSKQLHNSNSSKEQESKDKFNRLQSDLANVTRERDSLKQKLEAASESVKLIDQPIQELTRQLAGRFPENRSQRRPDITEGKQKANSTPQTPIWRGWFNTILLSFILSACVCTLCLVLKGHYKTSANHSDTATQETTTAGQEESGQDSDSQSEITVADSRGSTYDKWEDCTINIKGGGDDLKSGKPYSLSVAKKTTYKPATVPEGEWVVYTDPDYFINDGNSFTIYDPSMIGKNVLIEYIVNNKSVLTRTCTVKQ